MTFDSDPKRSASHTNQIAHLTGPFREGAREITLDLVGQPDGSTTTRMTEVSRRPLLLVGLRAPLGAMGISVRVDVSGAGITPSSVVLRFAPFSEAGAFLPAWTNASLPLADVVPPFTVAAKIVEASIAPKATDWLDVRLIEGSLGQLLYLMGAEKQRLRRQARELSALRELQFTFDADPANQDHQRMGHALDRLGADLGVPRLSDRLTWDAASGQPSSVTQRESNESFRQRLKIYRPFMLPNRRTVENALGSLGSKATFHMRESNTEFAVALQLVSSPDDTPRKAFLQWLRDTTLLQPGTTIPATRLLPSVVRGEQQAIVTRLATTFDFAAGSNIAPSLAQALDRVGRCRVALGVTRKWHVFQAQDDSKGSRYELGLGIEVEAPPATEIDTLAQNLTAKAIAPGTDVEIQSILASLTSAPSTTDPIGRWLLDACGLATVHASAVGRYYLSHFPMFGTVLRPAGGTPLALEAHFHAPNDPGQDAVLWYGLRDAVADAHAAVPVIPAWTELSAADAAAAWTGVTVAPTPAQTALQSAGLRTPSNPSVLATAMAALRVVPPELLTTLRLDPSLSSAILANGPSTAAAINTLTQLIGILRKRELASVLPVVRGTDVLLVVGASALPGGATILSSRLLAFRWYAVPFQGNAGTLDRLIGARTAYTLPSGSSLSAVVAVTFARKGQDDPRGRIQPYEVRVDVDDGASLDLGVYERVMNLLERTVPLGVVFDTHGLREHSIDPTGTGTTVPFTGRLAHTYRVFQQRRHLGAVNDQDQ